MVTLSVCAECKGKGSYKVFNAYDPQDVDVVVCEYCDGDGVLSEVAAPRSRGRQPLEDGWYN